MNMNDATLTVRIAYVLALSPLISVPWIIFPHVAARGLFVLSLGSIAVSLAFLWYVRHRHGFKPPVFLVLFFSYIVWMLLVSLIGVHPLQSILPSYERMDSALMLAVLSGMFGALFLPFFSEAVWKRLLIITLWVGSIVVVVAFAETLIQLPQSYPTVFFGNPTILASFLVIVPFLAGYAFSYARRVSTRYALAALALLSFAVSFLSEARGALLAFIVGSAWVAAIGFFTSARRAAIRTRAVYAGVAIIIGVAGLLLFVPSATAPLTNAVAQEISSFSKEPRFFLWKAALEGFSDRPFIGRGYGAFDAVFEEHYQPPLIAQEAWFDSAHNHYLDILIDGGIVGLLLYLAFFVSVLYAIHRRLFRPPSGGWHASPRAYLAGAVIAYLVNNVFIFSSLAPTLIVLAIVAYLLSDTERPAVARESIHGRFRVLPFLVWAPALFVVLVSFSSFVAGSAVVYGSNERLASSERLGAFRFARALPTFDRQGLDIAIAENAVRTRLSEPIPFRFSPNETAVAPGAARAAYAKGIYLFTRGTLDEAEVFLQAARDRMPEHPLIRRTLGEAYTARKKYDDAANEYRSAYETTLKLPHTFDFQFYIDSARQSYAAALVYAGRLEEAERLLAEYYGDTFIPYTPELLAAYYAQGSERHVLALLETAQTEEPHDPQLCFSFAAAQLKFGYRQGAIDTLERCARTFPATESDATLFIREINAGTVDLDAL